LSLEVTMSTLKRLINDSTPRLVLSPTTSVLEAARTMSRLNVGAAMVVDHDRRPLGIFTERDLMVRVVVAGRDAARVTIGEVMTRELFTAHCEEPLDSVKREVQRRHIRHIPVVESGCFIAMLSSRDLLYADLDERTHEVEALTEYIQGQQTPVE
jgi:signal-transduction protein with cAMP-binding, CBS, and nucleotidyltransferase domain